MSDIRGLPVGEDEEEEAKVTLDQLARQGARRMIAAALEAEVAEYVASFVDELDDDGIGWRCATAAARSGGRRSGGHALDPGAAGE